MSAYSNTALSNITIDIKWDMDLLEARYANAVIMPVILNKSDKVSRSGQQVSIQIDPTYTAGTVGAGGTFVPQAPVPTQANILINLWYQVSVEIDDQAAAQSFWNPTNKFATYAGKALAIQVDTSIANLYTGLNGLTAVGDPTTGVLFDDNQARIAMLRLANANIPTSDLTFILPPVAFYQGWLSKPELTAAYATGMGKSALITGAMTTAMGVPVKLSTLLNNVGGVIKGFLLHKQAFAIATQLNHEYKVTDRTSALTLSKVAVVDDLWGVQTIRSNHGVVLNVTATS